MLSGHVFAALFAALSSWALLLVASRALILQFDFDPWTFALVQMAAGGLAMMWLGRGTTRARETLLSPLTWLYGVLRVGTAAFFTAALVHTTTANAAFLGIVAVPLAALAAAVVLGAKPTRWELVGHGVVLAGLAAIAVGLDGGLSNPAVLLMLLSELCVVGASLIAELHPVNRGEDERSRAFLSGAVLCASAVALTLCLAVGDVLLPALFERDAARGLGSPLLLLSAIAVGAVLRGPSIHLSLRAIRLAGATRYLAAMATLPLMAFGFEAAFVGLGLLSPAPHDAMVFGLGVLCVAGSLGVLIARSAAEHRE